MLTPIPADIKDELSLKCWRDDNPLKGYVVGALKLIIFCRTSPADYPIEIYNQLSHAKTMIERTLGLLQCISLCLGFGLFK